MNLGELEKSVLQYFWDYASADAKEVHAYFSLKRGGSLNTIQSTLDRLYKKGLLKREKLSYAYIYRKALDKDAFIGKLVADVTKEFFDHSENALHAAFTSLSSNLTNEELEKLEALIDSRRTDKDQSS